MFSSLGTLCIQMCIFNFHARVHISWINIDWSQAFDAPLRTLPSAPTLSEKIITLLFSSFSPNVESPTAIASTSSVVIWLSDRLLKRSKISGAGCPSVYSICSPSNNTAAHLTTRATLKNSDEIRHNLPRRDRSQALENNELPRRSPYHDSQTRRHAQCSSLNNQLIGGIAFWACCRQGTRKGCLRSNWLGQVGGNHSVQDQRAPAQQMRRKPGSPARGHRRNGRGWESRRSLHVLARAAPYERRH